MGSFEAGSTVLVDLPFTILLIFPMNDEDCSAVQWPWRVSKILALSGKTKLFLSLGEGNKFHLTAIRPRKAISTSSTKA